MVWFKDELFLGMDSKPSAIVGGPQSSYIYWMALRYCFLCRYAGVWLHIQKRYSILVLFFRGNLHFHLFNIGCYRWETSSKNKKQFPLGATFWPWMWLFFNYFLYVGNMPSYKTWKRGSIFHFCCKFTFNFRSLKHLFGFQIGSSITPEFWELKLGNLELQKENLPVYLFILWLVSLDKTSGQSKWVDFYPCKFEIWLKCNGQLYILKN